MVCNDFSSCHRTCKLELEWHGDETSLAREKPESGMLIPVRQCVSEVLVSAPSVEVRDGDLCVSKDMGFDRLVSVEVSANGLVEIRASLPRMWWDY